jgi:hypothetical protein
VEAAAASWRERARLAYCALFGLKAAAVPTTHIHKTFKTTLRAQAPKEHNAHVEIYFASTTKAFISRNEYASEKQRNGTSTWKS